MHYRNKSPMESSIEANGKNSWHLKKGLRLLSKLVSAKASSWLVNSHLSVYGLSSRGKL